MIQKEQVFEKAYVLSRRDVEDEIERMFQLSNFGFTIDEDDVSRHLEIEPNYLQNEALKQAVRASNEDIDELGSDRFEDYAHTLMCIVTGDSLRNVLLSDGDRKLVCLA